MGCIVAPAAEAAVLTIASKIAEKKEIKSEGLDYECEGRIAWSTKLKWLTKLQWGGTALLALEHVWHGEISPVFPFLTAMNNPADMDVLIREIAVNGVGMAALTTLIWSGMLIYASKAEKSVKATGNQVTAE